MPRTVEQNEKGILNQLAYKKGKLSKHIKKLNKLNQGQLFSAN